MFNYILVLVLIALIFGYKLFLNILSKKSSFRPIPENLSDIYSEVEYKKWQEYHKKSIRLEIIELIVKYLVLFILFSFKLYALFSSLFKDNLVMQTLAVVLFSFIVDEVFGIWFDYYKTMVLDKEYGLSVTKIGTFIGDQIKDLVIGFGVTFGLVLLFGALHMLLGNWILVVFSGVLAIMVLVFTIFLPTFMRIYYRCDDLEEGELRTKVMELLEKNGYKVRKIGVMNQSKRSTTGNAMFIGMGKFKTIILYDTIIEQLTTDEIVAVFAHEVGHGKHRDGVRSYLISFTSVIVFVLIAWGLANYNSLFTDFGFGGVNYGFIAIILSEVIIELLAPIRDLLVNGLVRKEEYQADNFACINGYGEALATALKKMSNSNMANLNPHPLLVKIKYSHPTMSDRLTNIYNQINKEKV